VGIPPASVSPDLRLGSMYSFAFRLHRQLYPRKTGRAQQNFLKKSKRRNSWEMYPSIPVKPPRFTIYNIRTSFFYRDSKQKATITGNDTIVISGGVIETALSFNWTKASIITRNGSASANEISDIISFAKFVVIGNDSFYSYELLDHQTEDRQLRCWIGS
jgi:hypothetical protein